MNTLKPKPQRKLRNRDTNIGMMIADGGKAVTVMMDDGKKLLRTWSIIITSNQEIGSWMLVVALAISPSS